MAHTVEILLASEDDFRCDVLVGVCGLGQGEVDLDHVGPFGGGKYVFDFAKEAISVEVVVGYIKGCW